MRARCNGIFSYGGVAPSSLHRGCIGLTSGHLISDFNSRLRNHPHLPAAVWRLHSSPCTCMQGRKTPQQSTPVAAMGRDTTSSAHPKVWHPDLSERFMSNNSTSTSGRRLEVNRPSRCGPESRKQRCLPVVAQLSYEPGSSWGADQGSQGPSHSRPEHEAEDGGPIRLRTRQSNSLLDPALEVPSPLAFADGRPIIMARSCPGFLDLASDLMVGLKGAAAAGKPLAASLSSGPAEFPSTSNAEPAPRYAGDWRGSEPVMTLRAAGNIPIYNCLRAASYTQPHLEVVAGACSLGFTLDKFVPEPATEEWLARRAGDCERAAARGQVAAGDGDQGVAQSPGGTGGPERSKRTKLSLQEKAAKGEVLVDLHVWRLTKVDLASLQQLSDSGVNVTCNSKMEQLLADVQGRLLSHGYARIEFVGQEVASKAADGLLKLSRLLKRIDKQLVVLPVFVLWPHPKPQVPHPRHGASARQPRKQPGSGNPIGNFALHLVLGTSVTGPDAGLVVHPPMLWSAAPLQPGAELEEQSTVQQLGRTRHGPQQPRQQAQAESDTLSRQRRQTDALDLAASGSSYGRGAPAPRGAGIEPESRVVVPQETAAGGRGGGGSKRRHQGERRRQATDDRQAPYIEDGAVEEVGTDSMAVVEEDGLHGGVDAGQRHGAGGFSDASVQLKRYFITADNCSLKQAAIEIVKELLRSGQCLLLAEVDLDVRTALKVLMQAQTILAAKRSRSMLLFKARCYPDLEDSPHLMEPPDAFAIAFHVICTEASEVLEHLSKGVPTPCTPTVALLDMTASNYLRVAYRTDESAQTGRTVSSGQLGQQGRQLLDSEDWDGSQEEGDQGGPDEGPDTAAVDAEAAAEATAAWHDGMQRQLAKRAMHELAEHGVVHLGATSGPTRNAAVRAMTLVTEALGTSMRGLEALAVMSVDKVVQPDGFKLLVTTFTLMLAFRPKSDMGGDAGGASEVYRQNASEGGGFRRTMVRLRFLDPRRLSSDAVDEA